MSTKTISLDFYNHNIEYLKAKQNDTDRYINIVCTDYGKKVSIDSGKVTAFVKYKKSDGNIAFNGLDSTVVINEDGTVTVKLTGAMLASPGQQTFELVLVKSEGLNVDNLSSIRGYEDFGSSLISTMPFYVHVVASAFDDSEVTSLSEFSALTNAMTRMTAIDTNMRTLYKDVNDAEKLRVEAEQGRVKAETERQTGVNGETYRQQQETIRQTNELQRQNDVSGEAYRQRMENERQQKELERQTGQYGESYRQSEETKRQANETLRQRGELGETYRQQEEAKRQANETTRDTNFNNKITEYNNTISNKIAECESDFDTALSGKINEYNAQVNDVVQRGEDLITDINTAVNSGGIYQSEKGSANGVATLNESGIIPSTQLPIVDTIEDALFVPGRIFDAKSLAILINGLHVVHTGTENPSNDLGKDGDIYMKIIVDDEEVIQGDENQGGE